MSQAFLLECTRAPASTRSCAHMEPVQDKHPLCSLCPTSAEAQRTVHANLAPVPGALYVDHGKHSPGDCMGHGICAKKSEQAAWIALICARRGLKWIGLRASLSRAQQKTGLLCSLHEVCGPPLTSTTPDRAHRVHVLPPRIDARCCEHPNGWITDINTKQLNGNQRVVSPAIGRSAVAAEDPLQKCSIVSKHFTGAAHITFSGVKVGRLDFHLDLRFLLHCRALVHCLLG